jgi:phenylacetate-CoA ligase
MKESAMEEIPARNRSWLRGPLATASLGLADLGKHLALRHYGLFRFLAATPPGALERLGPLAAWRAADQARRRVPAYRTLLARSGWRDDPRLPVVERLRRLPVMDKESYIQAFSTEERCLDGRIPNGSMIDESAGSSGTPYNWVRSAGELRELHHEMSQFTRYYCQGANVVTINAFSMGAWATGVNVGEALRRNGIVKSTGPDVDKILHTLQFFGPRYRYVITGYPPFLKHLMPAKGGFDWSAYWLVGLVGGEGMSEALRDYLCRRFRAVYSGYGASDLDMGVAGESPLTIWIRQQAATDPRLKTALFGDDPRLPMLFHYNPLDYHLETNERGELIVTINRLAVLLPRIRYNVRDAGAVLAFDEMLARLRAFGLDPMAQLDRPDQSVFRLPFMYLFGRSDSTKRTSTNKN